MKKRDREAKGRLYRARLEASKDVYRRAMGTWNTLEDALGGVFPSLMPSANPQVDGNSRLYVSDQLNYNALLRIAWIMTSICADELPSLRFSREPDESQEAVTGLERMGEMLLDEGNFASEQRRAIIYTLTRGMWAMWPIVTGSLATPTEIRAGSINPADYIQAVIAGNDPEIPPGADCYTIAKAARSLLEFDNPVGLSLDYVQKARVAALAEECEVSHARYLASRHNLEYRARITYQATPYGLGMLIDPTVTDVSRASWIARKIVLDHEEFLDSPNFTDEAKKDIQPEEPGSADSVARTASYEMTNGEALEENGRITAWECWDRRDWSRYYVADNARVNATIGVDETYPYLDEAGEPLFRDFFPCATRTPIRHNRERAEQALGIPMLAPMWPMQVELIRTATAYLNACKRSGRTFTAAAGADETTLDRVARGDDGAIIRAPVGYDRSRDGPLLEKIEWGNAPQDFLIARRQILADMAAQGGISLATLTGEPVADTLGQEQMAMAGANLTQNDFAVSIASGVAEVARKGLMLFRAYASDAEWKAFIGKSGDTPGKSGQPLSVEMRAASLEGRKLVARLASSTRAEDLARQKTRMDWIVMLNGLRDSTGMPMFDIKSEVQAAAKEADMEGLQPYQPTQAELLAAALTQAMAQTGGAPGGGKGGNPNGGSSDDRKANGERGPAGIPGRQSRGRGPTTNSNEQGISRRGS